MRTREEREREGGVGVGGVGGVGVGMVVSMMEDTCTYTHKQKNVKAETMDVRESVNVEERG